jgi:GH24 family phage-related lysozyme (muramidase)
MVDLYIASVPTNTEPGSVVQVPVTQTKTQPDFMSDQGIEWLKKLEGTIKNGDKHVIYNDSLGYATIGYGHLVAKRKVKDLTADEIAPYKDGLTEDAATTLFKNDLKWVEDGIHKNVSSNLTQPQFDALVSIGFNAGRSALVRSSIVKSIDAGDVDKAAENIKSFNT